MESDDAQPPARWVRDLARSDEDIKAGRVVPASVVHDVLRAALTRMGAAVESGTDHADATPADR